MSSYVSVLKFNPNHDKTGRFAGKSAGGTLHFYKPQPQPKAKPQPSQAGLFDLLDLLIGNRRKPKAKKKPGPVVQVHKFNPHHDKENGRFTFSSGSGSKGTGSKRTPAQQAIQDEFARQEKKPVHKVKSAEEAVALVLKGENVEIQDTKDVHTVLKKLGEMALEAKSKGSKAPNFDPCTITVKGVSLFCTEKIRTEEFPHGIPRIEMPQFKSLTPIQGSEADKLPRDDQGEVDASGAFLAHLTDLGVKTEVQSVLARKLKASQAEMEGAKVAGMMLNEKRNPKEAHIWVSKDGYVIDGHHTWASAVGRDAEDGNLDNDMKMKVVVVDMPMSEVYHLAKKWTRAYGLPGHGVKKVDFRTMLVGSA
jgi:hypothetical protein